MTDAAPPFQLSRETRIRIDREGRFWHEQDPITHEALAKSLASWVDIDPDSGRYILKNSVNWAFVTVDDTPLVVRSLDGDDVILSDGVREPLDVSSLRIDGEDVPYCDVRGGKIPARFGRNAAYALLKDATVGADGQVIVKVGSHEVRPRRVAVGEGGKRRPGV
jgi:uncharacterized protein